MPQIIVRAAPGDRPGAVTLQERVTGSDLNSVEFASLLVERMGWLSWTLRTSRRAPGTSGGSRRPTAARRTPTSPTAISPRTGSLSAWAERPSCTSSPVAPDL